MSYGYQDPHYDNHMYKIVDDGNQGNNECEYEYESYSDHVEPDHWESDHTPSEPDHHDYEHDTTNYNNHVNCENNANDANQEIEKAYQPRWSEYEGSEAYEHRELAHGNNGTGEDWEGEYGRGIEGYEHGGVMIPGKYISKL